MAAVYPGAIYSSTSPSSKRDGKLTQGEWVDAIDEINAIESTLGVNPQGSDGDLVTRLNRIDSNVAGFGDMGYRNLTVLGNSDTTVVIGADRISIEGQIVNNLSVTANISTTGAGGRDTGSETSNAWWYYFAIWNPTTATANGLFSVSATAPTMPSGYTKKHLLGAARNDGSSNLLRFFQQDEFVSYSLREYDVLADTDPANTNFSTLTCSGFIPPISRMGLFQGRFVIDSGSTQVQNALRLKAGNAAGGDDGLVALTLPAISLGNFPLGAVLRGGAVWVGLNTSQQIGWRVEDDTDADVAVGIACHGFRLGIK